MTGHNPQVIRDQADLFYASCNCGWNSGPNRYQKKWEAEDHIVAHTANVERALASLRRRAPSLKEERDHSRKMIDDPNTSAADRAVWQVLFDGSDQRLNDHAGPDEGLWDA